jgi:hypothetical protein
MRIACWIPKATDTHSAYAILIVSLRKQQFHEAAVTLHYTCMAGLVLFTLIKPAETSRVIFEGKTPLKEFNVNLKIFER